ncbi:transposase [Chryseobacterium sp.]
MFKSRFYGFKLHIIITDKGELLSFCVTKANVMIKNL